jgi:hypothetical protein
MHIIVGIWLVQILTALVLWLNVPAVGPLRLGLSVVLALGIGALAAVWIRGTLKNQLKLLEAHHGERLAQTSEVFRAELSRQKAGEAERLAELARSSGNSRTGLLRAGILTGGALGVGAALVMAQFIGMGLLLAAFAGGGAAGYAISSKLRRPTPEAVPVPPAGRWLPEKPKRLRLTAVRD